MSDAPDLSKIRPPDPPPADQPDQRAAAEAQDAKRKGPSPLEREAEAHRNHITALRERADYHQRDCEQLRAEIARTRESLDETRQREKNLDVRYKQLETASSIGGCFNVLGLILTIVGPTILGIAGAAPGLNDVQKYGYCLGGGAITACGVLILLISYIAAWRQRPK